MRNQIIEAR